MTIKAFYFSRDEIPEAYADLYEEKDGAFRLSKIDGIKTDADVSRLSSALEKERKDHQESKRKLDTILQGKKPEELLSILDKIPELEAGVVSKPDDEKLAQLLEARLKSKIAPIERERDQLRQQALEYQQRFEEYNQKERQRKVSDCVRQAALKCKVIDTAQEDVLLLAERVFELNEEGTPVVKNGVGSTPGVTADIWLLEMQSKRPHWWPSAVGAGTKGSGGGSIFSENPWSASSWSVTEQGRVVRTMGVEKAVQMASSAGVDYHNPRRPSK